MTETTTEDKKVTGRGPHPGPWSLTGRRSPYDSSYSVFGRDPAPDGYVFCPRIASVSSVGGPSGSSRDRANAHLIAAAPDLFAACEALVNYVNKGHRADELEQLFVEAEAALRKARGEAQ